MNNDIHEAIQFIISSLEKQGQSPGTLKNYINSFHVFERYLAENSICEVNEEICLKYIQFKTGKQIDSFRSTTLDPNLNRRMKPLHLLLMYLDTGTFQYEPRKQVPLFRCPPDYLEVYQCFEEYCRAKAYAGATMEINIRHVRKLLLYLESQEVGEPDQITASHLEAFLHTYEGASVKYIGTVLYVLRNFGHFLFHQGFTSCDISCLLPKTRIPRNGSVPYSWKKEDVKKLLEAVDREDPKGKRDYAILLMVTRLGLRIGDIRNLRLKDINWVRRSILIIMQKTGQPLELPLLEDIGWAVIDYLKNGRPSTGSDRLFVRHRPPFSSFGERESLHKELHRYMVKAGLDTAVVGHHGMHSLRSTLAKNMLDSGAPLPVISETLGHQNINTTAIYLKIDLEGLRRCALDPEEVFRL
ncbi:hypothetical protein ADH76_24560 [Enterocloster clostridioformis]|nr:hypothetical protein A4V08_13680 [Lachnoclostridium sp. YL32]OXE65403.1 hypothetical protein ADH76_24560 [Enterocloster clostridioformis]QQQ98589.1 tyrosine-type recombinase/integrase [Enterocloster clostridioformis]